MENVRDRIAAIEVKRNLSNEEIRDELLMLDAENVDLGFGATEKEKIKSKKDSRIIIRSIKPYDKEAYDIISKGFDL